MKLRKVLQFDNGTEIDVDVLERVLQSCVLESIRTCGNYCPQDILEDNYYSENNYDAILDIVYEVDRDIDKIYDKVKSIVRGYVTDFLDNIIKTRT